MQAYGTPPRPVPGPAVTAEAVEHPAPARGVRPADGWFLNEMRARAERQREAIHARNEWIEARKRELWARMDRLRDEIGPRASSTEGHGPSPGEVAPIVPASPDPGDGGSPEALASSVPAGPSSSRSAAILQDLAECVDTLIGIVSRQGPGAVRDDAPRPVRVVEAGAAG